MFLFCLVFAVSLCVSVYMCFVVTCWERADLLQVYIFIDFLSHICANYHKVSPIRALSLSNGEFVTFPLVTWVRCGT